MKIIEKQNTLTIQAESSQNHYIYKEHEPHVIKLMYEKLYSNKPLAVIREYICNAMDSHRVAGKPISDITVHLPTEFEPWFSVKDVGIGMSPDDVKKFYSSYGHSTKRDDEHQIGMFGIGSKAAFCMCDTFEVIARKDGVETYAVCSVAVKPGENTGSTNIIYTTKTTEPNGVEVKVPVDDKSKHETFIIESLQLFMFSDVHPMFNHKLNLVVRDENSKIFDCKYFEVHMWNCPDHRYKQITHNGVSYSSFSLLPDVNFYTQNMHLFGRHDSSCIVLKDDFPVAVNIPTNRECISNIQEVMMFVKDTIDSAALSFAKKNQATFRSGVLKVKKWSTIEKLKETGFFANAEKKIYLNAYNLEKQIDHPEIKFYCDIFDSFPYGFLWITHRGIRKIKRDKYVVDSDLWKQIVDKNVSEKLNVYIEKSNLYTSATFRIRSPNSKKPAVSILKEVLIQKLRECFPDSEIFSFLKIKKEKQNPVKIVKPQKDVIYLDKKIFDSEKALIEYLDSKSYYKGKNIPNRQNFKSIAKKKEREKCEKYGIVYASCELNDIRFSEENESRLGKRGWRILSGFRVVKTRPMKKTTKEAVHKSKFIYGDEYTSRELALASILRELGFVRMWKDFPELKLAFAQLVSKVKREELYCL